MYGRGAVVMGQSHVPVGVSGSDTCVGGRGTTLAPHAVTCWNAPFPLSKVQPLPAMYSEGYFDL